jgi:hypothetical protein
MFMSSMMGVITTAIISPVNMHSALSLMILLIFGLSVTALITSVNLGRENLLYSLGWSGWKEDYPVMLAIFGVLALLGGSTKMLSSQDSAFLSASLLISAIGAICIVLFTVGYCFLGSKEGEI